MLIVSFLCDLDFLFTDQEIESMAVGYNHPPFHRCFVWKVVGFLLNRIGVPILKKH